MTCIPTPDHPDVEAVQDAARRISGSICRTPLLRHPDLDELAQRPVYFKYEGAQITGSFKARGAANAVFSLPDHVQHVATHSSGNHGAALAWAAQKHGVRATVVVPRGARPGKIANIERYGATVVFCGPTLAEREATLAQWVERTGASVVPPFDDPRVIAGQGTLALEVLAELSEVAALWVPVGGGGLAAGCAIVCAAQGLRLSCGEPELARDAHDSLLAGKRMPQLPPLSIADGLGASLGKLNFSVLNRYRPSVHLVTENDIELAQAMLQRALKVAVEPSSAVAFAALLKTRATHAQAPEVVVLTGANV